MDSVKMKGRNVEEAVAAALEVLGAKKEEVDIVVLKEGKGGVLGMFGGEDAEVEVSKAGSPAEKAKSILQEILDLAGFTTSVSIEVGDDGQSLLEVKGDDLGRIIGKDGATLIALQTILSSILSRKAGRRESVYIDAQGYKKRRGEKMKSIATDAIEEALSRNKEVILPPMPAPDRREVHMAIQEDGRATSFSQGEGSERRIVVSPNPSSGPAEGGRPKKGGEAGEGA